MKQRIPPLDAVLAAAVLLHLGITLAHGAAHLHANVALSPGSMGFVLAVILIGPVLGLLVRSAGWPRRSLGEGGSLRRLGAWLVASTMAGALVFGLVNHFLLPGADHVAHVTGQWQLWFGITAVLLVVSEGFGSAVAVRCAILEGRQS